MSHAGKTSVVTLIMALASAAAPVAQAQPPIRIGALISETGPSAVPAPNQLRGYQLCVKHTNEKGGVVGRKLELVVHDDGSDRATAGRLYERLITRDKVDLVLGPYGSGIADAAADVTEKHRMPLVAPTATDSSLYKKGRKFIFSMQPPAEIVLEGLLDLAAKKGLRTVALIHAEIGFGRAVTKGGTDLAKKKGLQVIFVDAYPRESTAFSTILTKVREANPDVLGVASGGFEDLVSIIRQMKASTVNPKMIGLTVGVELPKFYATLGRDADFVYGVTAWLPELVDLRAGGLIPIARQYPGAREFVESYKREFPGADLSQFSAAGYGGCQILVEAIRRVGSLDSGKLRDAISKMDHNTVFGGFRVDGSGVQLAHKFLLFQWQGGKKVIVWPEELAPNTPRFPTPPWSQRP